MIVAGRSVLGRSKTLWGSFFGGGGVDVVVRILVFWVLVFGGSEEVETQCILILLSQVQHDRGNVLQH